MLWTQRAATKLFYGCARREMSPRTQRHARRSTGRQVGVMRPYGTLRIRLMTRFQNKVAQISSSGAI
jgi:hypothetical protein